MSRESKLGAEQLRASRRGRRYEALQELAVPGHDQREAHAPHAGPHQVHAQEARHQEVHVAGAGLGDLPRLPAGEGVGAPGGALQRGIHREPSRPALGLRGVVRVGRRPRPPTPPGPRVRGGGPACGLGLGQRFRRSDPAWRARAAKPRRSHSLPSTTATGSASGGRLRNAIPRTRRSGSGKRTPRTRPRARGRARAHGRASAGPPGGPASRRSIIAQLRPVSATNTSSRVAWWVARRRADAALRPAAASIAGSARCTSRTVSASSVLVRDALDARPPASASTVERRLGLLDVEFDDLLGADLAISSDGVPSSMTRPRSTTADAIAQPFGLVHVVRGQDDRPPARLNHRTMLPHLATRLGIQPGRRLVEEQHLGVGDERARRPRAAAAVRPRASRPILVPLFSCELPDLAARRPRARARR